MLRTQSVVVCALTLIGAAIAAAIGRADESDGNQYVAQVEGGDPGAALSDGTWITLGRFNSLDEAYAAERLWNDAHPGNLRLTREIETKSDAPVKSNAPAKSDVPAKSDARAKPSGPRDNVTQSLEDGSDAIAKFNHAVDDATDAIHAAHKTHDGEEIGKPHGPGDTIKEFRHALEEAFDRVVHVEHTLTTTTSKLTAAQFDRMNRLIADYNREAASYDSLAAAAGQPSVRQLPGFSTQQPQASDDSNGDKTPDNAPATNSDAGDSAATPDNSGSPDSATPQDPGYLRIGRPAPDSSSSGGNSRRHSGRSYPEGQRLRIINPGYQGSPASVTDLNSGYVPGFGYDQSTNVPVVRPGPGNNQSQAPTSSDNSSPRPSARLVYDENAPKRQSGSATVPAGGSVNSNAGSNPASFSGAYNPPASVRSSVAPSPSVGAPKGVLMRLGIDPSTLEKSELPAELLERLHKAS